MVKMRPDQHKKKKSAEYRRKQQISSTNKREQTVVSNELAPAPGTSEGDSDTENKRGFSRRKIESNWRRYEEIHGKMS